MRNWIQWLILAVILLLALALRWTGIDWDDYNHNHPDERYITWVATTIEWPSSWRDALDPVRSSFNPFYWPADAESTEIIILRDEPRKFAYGHFPLYLSVAATRLVEKIGPGLQSFFPDGWLLTSDILNARNLIEFRHLTAVTRGLTGLVDALLILILFLIGRRMYSAEVGLLAAAFLALNVMHIQLSHFFAADPYMALFVALALYFMIRGVIAGHDTPAGEDGSDEKGRLWRYLRCRPVTCNLLLASFFIGLAVGSKFAAIMLFLPLVTAVLLGRTHRRWALLLASALVAFLVFFITNPFAILDLGCEAITPVVHLGPLTIPELDWRSCYLQNIFTQGAMVRGEIDLGFTRQYAGTWPYLYPIEMQLRWGMGWLLGLLAFAGFGWAIWQAIRYAAQRINARSLTGSEAVSAQGDASLVLLAWTLPFFLTTGSFYVKFMRYLLPLTPFLMLYAAALLWQLRNRTIRYLAVGVVLAVTAVYALSFVNIYNSDHPWNNASRWVYANVEPGTLIASEQWDDSLPTSMLVDGRLRRHSEYEDEQLTWLTGPDEKDTEEKLEKNLDLLERAEYLTIMSNRIYGVVPRLPQRYPLSNEFHQLLFDGTLGYEPVFVNTRTPNLFGLHLKPDSFVWPAVQPPPMVETYLSGLPGFSGGRFDESFTVYDQPLVTIFKNIEGKTAEEMRQHFSVE
jgi:4-amino-4-deoxy-L-arabinose transferase-like glycosyltransferase